MVPTFTPALKKQTLLTLSYTRAGKTYQGKRFHNVWTTDCILVSDWSKFFSLRTVYRYGREINYFSYPLELGYLHLGYFSFDFKPLSRLSLCVDYHKYLLKDERKTEVAYEQSTYEYKLACSLSHQLTTRLIIQHDSDNNEMVF